MTELTPADRDQIQLYFLKRWLAVKCPKGTRRQTDLVLRHYLPVHRFDIKGKAV